MSYAQMTPREAPTRSAVCSTVTKNPQRATDPFSTRLELAQQTVYLRRATIRVVHRLAIHERGLFGSSVLLSVLQISQRSKSGGSFSERMILKEFSGQRGQQSQKCHNPLMSRRYSIGIQTRTHTKPVVVLVPRGIAPEQMIGQSLRSSTESQTALECQVFDTPRGCVLRPCPAIIVLCFWCSCGTFEVIRRSPMR